MRRVELPQMAGYVLVNGASDRLPEAKTDHFAERSVSRWLTLLEPGVSRWLAMECQTMTYI